MQNAIVDSASTESTGSANLDAAMDGLRITALGIKQQRDEMAKVLRDLLDKIEVMNGCNDHDFDVKCSDVAWPEFHAAHAALANIRTAANNNVQDE